MQRRVDGPARRPSVDPMRWTMGSLCGLETALFASDVPDLAVEAAAFVAALGAVHGDRSGVPHPVGNDPVVQ